MTALLPYLIAALAIACYATLGPIAKKVGLHLPPFSFIACSSAITCLCGATLGFMFEREKVVAAMNDINWGWLVAFSLINMAGYVFYLLALRKIPVAQYEMFGILMPIIGGFFAVYLLKEPFHARYFLALVFMATGLWIAIGPELKGK